MTLSLYGAKLKWTISVAFHNQRAYAQRCSYVYSALLTRERAGFALHGNRYEPRVHVYSLCTICMRALRTHTRTCALVMKTTLMAHLSLAPYKESVTIVRCRAVGRSFRPSGASYAPGITYAKCGHNINLSFLLLHDAFKSMCCMYDTMCSCC